MAVQPTQHRLTKIDLAERSADCAKCGRVRIKSAGSNGRGGTRWRCAAQVNLARKAQREEHRQERVRVAQERHQQRYGLDIALPCCQTIDHLDPPTERNRFGELWEDYLCKCRSCGTHYLARVEMSDDSDGDLTGIVGAVHATVVFITVEQSYIDGRLDSTFTAREGYEACIAPAYDEQEAV